MSSSQVIDLCSSNDEDAQETDSPPNTTAQQPPLPIKYQWDSSSDDDEVIWKPPATTTNNNLSHEQSSHAEPSHTHTPTTEDGSPTLEFWKFHCWNCQVELARTNTNSCYALHQHPTLEVPICCICSEQVVLAEEQLARQDSCCTCGREDQQLLFLCDVCPRAVCDTCITQAYLDPHMPQKLQNNDEKWQCIVCRPPLPLQELRANLLQESSSEQEPSLENLLQQLEMAEDKMLECEKIWEQQEGTWRAIQQELEADKPAAQEEFRRWKHQLKNHDQRLSDRIAGLQDVLERVHEFNCKEFYATTTTPTEEETTWKQAADQAISARDQAERKKIQQFGPSSSSSDDESDSSLNNPKDIDDLGSLSSEDNDICNNDWSGQWRHAPRRVSKKKMASVLCLENQKLAKNGLKTARKVSEQDDCRAMENEPIACIRRDFVVVAQRRKAVRKKSTGVFSGPDDGSDVSEDGSSLFGDASFVLADNGERSIAVAEPLTMQLKLHQRQGIEFMFHKCFADLAFNNKTQDDIGGCILAHNMGLGKSFSTVTLIHTLLHHPSLHDTITKCGLIKTFLLVVPVNTLMNWENEFFIWTGKLAKTVPVTNLSSGSLGSRSHFIRKWGKKGGVLLMSDSLFQRAIKNKDQKALLQNPGPDVIVVDEAHTMLKNKTQVFKALMGVKTKRRICLTGSPFQNNLFEYFRMISYVRPGLLGTSERAFEKEFVLPIVEGEAADTKDELKQFANEKLHELKDKIEPFVHRKDATVLLQDLPPMQQVVLHLRRTKVQNRLYSTFKRRCISEKGAQRNNFLRTFHELRPIHNHPGCLLKSASNSRKVNTTTEAKPLETVPAKEDCNGPKQVKQEPKDDIELMSRVKEGNNTLSKKDISSTDRIQKNGWPKNICDIIDLITDSEEEDPEDQETIREDILLGKEWWRKENVELLANPTSGNKVVLLLHILVHASILDEKVVVFSQCLKTLDFVSEVLSQRNWQKLVPSLAASFPGHLDKMIGGWKAGVEFLRIDGQTAGDKRGDLVKEFNEDFGFVRLFLISSRAGGMGINLCSANRVVLFDSHFNPTVDTQALYRCYRYGQRKSVFAYRFLTERTIEQKVYSRAVNKLSLGLRLVDGKSISRCFTSAEIADLGALDDWVCCETCNKWRMFPPQCTVDTLALPDKWHCEMMNGYNKRMILDCTFPEQDTSWYKDHFQTPNEESHASSPGVITISSDSNTSLSKEKTEKLIARDEILLKLLEVKAKDRDAKIVSKHYFHDALLEEKDIEDSGGTPVESTPVKRRCKKRKK